MSQLLMEKKLNLSKIPFKKIGFQLLEIIKLNLNNR